MKHKTNKIVSIMLALTMILSSVIPVTVFAEPTPAPAAPTFENISDESGDVISLADKKTFKVSIPVEAEIPAAELESVVWSLTFDEAATTESYMDPSMFPNHSEGGDMTDSSVWHKQDGYYWYGMEIDDAEPLFENFKAEMTEVNGQKVLTLTFSNACYWSITGEDPSVAHDVGGEYMDVCGIYDLTATYNDSVLGTVEDILVTPYDSFNTMQNIYAELDEMVQFAAENTDLYVAKKSMGQSSGKLYDPMDMPYLIVADSSASVQEWLDFTEKAETDPDGVLKDLAAGKYDDLKVPVMYSNIHANETAAADGIMEFAWLLLNSAAAGTANYSTLTGFTAEGEAQLAAEMAAGSVLVPELIADKATYLGFITDTNNGESGVVDLEKYYNVSDESVDMSALLDDVFFILVPEENVEGRTFLTREASNGYDLNRDNSFQTTPETQNMQKLIGTYNPVSLMEYHGRVEGFQVEPCSPPHEPNFEYDLLSENLLPVGEAFGNAAVASNDGYNSYTMPARDYLYDEGGTNYWYAWDDMSTSYTPQFAMLHGTLAYTVELPAYNDDTAQAVAYGCLGQSDYIASQKNDILTAQTEIFQRGVSNANSNSTVNPWLVDQADTTGAEASTFRPVYDGEGENGNFYPEFYIIPLDGENQTNLAAAYEMMEWLSRNDVKILVTEDTYTFDGVTYPAGTMIITMYQAKRSVANGALYNGTFITTWDALYSEGITCFNETRGFDMATVVKANEWKNVKSVCGTFMDYEECLSYIADNATSYFTGVKNVDVIISNASEDSTAAVNALLQSGEVVGMVTDEESKFYGDFICSYDAYTSVASDYILSATGISSKDSSYPTAKVITKAPTVYLTGQPSEMNYGFIYTNYSSGAYEWNYDKCAMEMMGFNITTSLDLADVIVGASSLSSTEKSAVLAGTPLMAFGTAVPAVNGWYGSTPGCSDLVDFTCEFVGGMDALVYVDYPTTNLINSSYVMDGDDIHYNYSDNGVTYFTSIPEGAEALVAVNGSKDPMEGFIPLLSSDAVDTFNDFMNGGILGFSYEGKASDGESDINVAMFANTLTHKVHQRDEYAYISNFIFSNLLGAAYEPAEDTSGAEGGSTDTTVAYQIISGANQTAVAGKPLTFKSDAAFSKFVKVLVDDKEVASENYTVAEGSTVVTLKAAYVDTLAAGVHTLTIVSTDGSATTQFTVTKDSAPETGDNSQMILWFAVMAVAAAAGTCVIVGKKKHHVD